MMKIPLAVPNLTGNERAYLNRCIDTTFVSSVGEFVNQIEKMTAEKCNARYGVATSSGTTGLHLALTGVGVKRDELVVVPTFTFIASANAVAHCGAAPWLMDISEASWTLDAEQVERELAEKTVWRDSRLIHRDSGRRVAAIMPVYTMGNVPDMDRLRKIAAQYYLPLIADAAAALGARYKEKNIGELADLSVISFNGNKTVTAGGGGMVVGNNEELMKKLKHLSTTARVSAEYDHDAVGFNYRMTNIQAAVGCAQMEQMEEFVAKKRRIRGFYDEAFAEVENLSLFPIPQDVESACWFSGIVLNQGGLEQVKSLCAKLGEKGIEARSFWKPVHLQKPYQAAVKADSLANSANLWNRIVTLPCSTNISEEELEYVAETVKEIL